MGGDVMDITVRLYKLHDYDLIYLYKNLRFPIKDAMKKALLAYVRNEPVFIDFPVEKVNQDNLTDIKSAQFHLKLDAVADADAIEYLGRLKKYYRNSFLKNLLRGYLTGPASYVYESDFNENDTLKREENIKNSMLGIESLERMKVRQKKKYVVLTESEKELFDMTGALDGVDVVIKED